MTGIADYKTTVMEFNWFRSLPETSMILSGEAFIGTDGILNSPIAHRFSHKLHSEE